MTTEHFHSHTLGTGDTDAAAAMASAALDGEKVDVNGDGSVMKRVVKEGARMCMRTTARMRMRTTVWLLCCRRARPRHFCT